MDRVRDEFGRLVPPRQSATGGDRLVDKGVALSTSDNPPESGSKRGRSDRHEDRIDSKRMRRDERDGDDDRRASDSWKRIDERRGGDDRRGRVGGGADDDRRDNSRRDDDRRHHLDDRRRRPHGSRSRSRERSREPRRGEREGRPSRAAAPAYTVVPAIDDYAALLAEARARRAEAMRSPMPPVPLESAEIRVMTEIAPMYNFEGWAVGRRDEAQRMGRTVEGLTLDSLPREYSQAYDKYRQKYRVAATDILVANHSHEWWFRKQYEPAFALAQHEAALNERQRVSKQLLKTIREGSDTITALLPAVGGDFSGQRGGLLPVATTSASSAPASSGSSSDVEFIADALHEYPSTSHKATTPHPILFIRGVHPSISPDAVSQILHTCGMHLSGSVSAITGGECDVFERAVHAAVDDLEAFYKHMHSGDATHRADARSIDYEQVLRTYRVAVESESDEADGAATLSTVRGYRLPQVTRIEYSDPRHLASLNYRYNVWVQYSCAMDAAIARHLLHRKPFAVPQEHNAGVWMKEIKRLASLADRPEAVDYTAAKTLTADAVEADLAVLSEVKSVAAAAQIFKQMVDVSIPSNNTNNSNHPPDEAASAGFSHLPRVPEAILFDVHWHEPTYGAPLGTSYSAAVGVVEQRLHDKSLMNEDALQLFLISAYPYGKKYTTEIPSWASTPSQVALDLVRAVSLCALLDVEAGLLSQAKEESDRRRGDEEDAHITVHASWQHTKRSLLSLAGMSSSTDVADNADTDMSPDAVSAIRQLLTRAQQDCTRTQVDADAAARIGSVLNSADVSPLVASSNLFQALAASNLPVLQQLDTALLYLRYVHFYDYYSGLQGESAGDIRQLIGDGYKRLAAPSSRRAADSNTAAASKEATDEHEEGKEEAPVDEELPDNNNNDHTEEPDVDATQAAFDEADTTEPVATGATNAEPNATTSPAKVTAATVAVDSPIFAGCSPAAHLHSDRAKAAANEWAKRQQEKCRTRASAALGQIVLDVALVPTTLSKNAFLDAAADADAVLHTQDGLIPFTTKDTHSPTPWRVFWKHAELQGAIIRKLVASVHEYVLLAPFYVANIIPDGAATPNAVTEASQRRLISQILTDDAASVAARSRCALCSKVFKAPIFLVKHLHNKHPHHVSTVQAKLSASLTNALQYLTGIRAARLLYFCDPRRPLPWQDPARVKLMTESSAHSARKQAMEFSRMGLMVLQNGGATRIPPGGGVIPPMMMMPGAPNLGVVGMSPGLGLLGAAPGALAGPMLFAGMDDGDRGNGRSRPRSRPPPRDGNAESGREAFGGTAALGVYRDKDAVKPAGGLAALSKPTAVDYGSALISYEDI